jgi:hypothetical protein
LDPAITELAIAAYQKGFRTLFLMCAGITTLSFFIAVGTIQHHDLSRQDDTKQKELARVWLASLQHDQKSKDKDSPVTTTTSTTAL